MTEAVWLRRFGFRQPHSKTAKVGDVSVAAEHAFGSGKDKETAINNNALGKQTSTEFLRIFNAITILRRFDNGNNQNRDG